MPLGMLGKYERLDVLGHGTSGIVYLAKDTLLGRMVALKEVAAQGDDKERVLAEARVLDRLRHPNIVQVAGVDEIHGKVVIAMEYVRGQSLLEVLRHCAPLPVADAVDIAAQVCEGLAFAHGHRTIHRDVKPANILVGHDGIVKLVDFGLAEVLGTHSVAGGAGTYAYMAPEDFHEDEQSGRQSDIWAAGVVLYEMLAGRRPFGVAKTKDPFAWRRAIETDPLPSLSVARPDAPPALQAIVARALARDLGARYADASLMARDLHAAAALLPPSDLGTLAGASAPAFGKEDNTNGLPAPHTPQSANSAYSAQGDAPTAALSPVPSLGPHFPPPPDIDTLLSAAPDHWEAARDALTNGALARWLGWAGEKPLALLAEELAADPAHDPDSALRDFLYRAGVETVALARRSFAEGERAAARADWDEAVRALRRAVHLDPSYAVYHDRLARALRASGQEPDAAAPPAAPPPAVRSIDAAAPATITPARADFGLLRRGQVRTLKVSVRGTGRGVVQGRVASAPGWVQVEPATFSTRQRQPLRLTATASHGWPAGTPSASLAPLEDAVVLEIDGTRQSVAVSAWLLPARLGFWQVAFWYVPLLLCCLLPLLAGISAPTLAALHGTTHGLRALHFLWQPGAAASGLLCGALFVLAASADTVWGLRLLPLGLLCLCVGRFAGAAPSLGGAHEALARTALVQTCVPVLVLLLLQAASAAIDPMRWGRWQVWRWIVGATGLLASYALLHTG